MGRWAVTWQATCASLLKLVTIFLIEFVSLSSKSNLNVHKSFFQDLLSSFHLVFQRLTAWKSLVPWGRCAAVVSTPSEFGVINFFALLEQGHWHGSGSNGFRWACGWLWKAVNVDSLSDTDMGRVVTAFGEPSGDYEKQWTLTRPDVFQRAQ